MPALTSLNIAREGITEKPRNTATACCVALLLLFGGTLWSLSASALPSDERRDATPIDDGSLGKNSREQLETAFEYFLDGLEKAAETLVEKRHFAPESTDRVLAEGYRYMLGHLNRSIEFEMRADPRFPEFFRSMSMLRKWTGENPDAMYLKAPIDATGYYKLTGVVADHREWQDAKLDINARKAPRSVSFQTITDVPGHSGELAEMHNCHDQTLEYLTNLDMQIDAGGHFTILIGPERPQDYSGNFLLSRKLLHCATTKKEAIREANWLAVREVFSDWEHEVAIDMDIVRLDSIGASRPHITIDDMSKKLRYMADEVPNQIRFWNQVMAIPLEMTSDVNGDGRRNLPVNGINPPAPPFTAGGVAGARQIYAAGIHELQDNEALVIKVTSPIEPFYVGFQINNLWMEGPDQQNYVSSLTGHQLPPGNDGSRYYIIAHKDPGYRGWVATTGLEKGFHAMRFVFREDAISDENLPRAEATKMPVDQLGSFLPEGTPRVTAEQRRREIAIRQTHIKQRWRGH